MKKQVLSAILLGAISMLFFNACDKGKEDQENTFESKQHIDFTIRVVDASNSDLPLEGVEVEIVDGIEIRTVTTDASGLASFEDVLISDHVFVTISKADYAPIYSEADITTRDNRQAQAGRTFRLYPLTGENMATIRGKLTIETDMTNREREAVPWGETVRAYNYGMATDIGFTGSTDSTGAYEIRVPVSFEGKDDITLEFPEIYTGQRLALKSMDDYTISVVERPALFSLSAVAKKGAIPALPSVYAVIDAPRWETIGSGFAVGVKALPTYLSSYTQLQLIHGGTGYTNGVNQLITVSDGVYGSAAQIQVDIANGSIINIDGVINNGALYTSKPSINTNVLGGSGALLDVLFESNYRVYITDNGKDYVTFPNVFMEYTYYDGTALRENTLEIILANITNLSGGRIVNDNFADVDTIYNRNGVASAPVFTIVNEPTAQMYIDFDVDDVSNTGQVSGHNVQANGYGYDPGNPPDIELLSVAGYGRDAVYDIDLTAQGSYSSIDRINVGTGYVRNVNDFADDGTLDDSQEDPGNSLNASYDEFRYIRDVVPGSTFIRSAYYGTGTPND